MTATPKFSKDFVGDVPWGTHLCQFYETKDDLIEILVPYFAEGLRSNDACMWITSEPLGAEEAIAALAEAVPDVDRFIQTGQLLILSYQEWYLTDGTFDADRVLKGWVEKEREALSRGFNGLRLTGNTFWIQRSLWDSFTDYEEMINNVIGAHHIIGVCTYNLSKCRGSDVADVIRNHVGTIIKKGGSWIVVEDIAHRKEAEVALTKEREEVRSLNETLKLTNTELQRANAMLEHRVRERADEVTSISAELQTTNTELRHEIEQRSSAERAVRAHDNRMTALYEIIHELNQASDLENLYEHALLTVVSQLEFLGGFVASVSDTGHLDVLHAHNLPAAFVKELDRMPVDVNPLARGLFGQDKLYVLDATPSETIAYGYGLRGAAVGIPFFSEGRAVGQIALYDERPRSFTAEDRQLFIAIGEEFGTTVSKLTAKARAEEFARHQKVITNVIAAGNRATSLQSATAAMVDTTMDMLGFDSGGIFLREADAVIAQYVRGYTREQRAWAQRLPLTQRRVARVMGGKPWISSDYQGDVSPEAKVMNKAALSMATIPLVAVDEVIGFYQLADSRRKRNFTSRDVDLLISVGQEAGTVIGRLLAEEALKWSEARSRDLLERSFDAVLIHSEGKIRFANAEAARILKAESPETLVGNDVLTIPTAEFRTQVVGRIAHLYEARAATDPAEMQLTTLDGGSVDVEVMGAYTSYENVPAIYLVFRDITRRKSAEAELQRRSDHLEQLVEKRTTQLATSEEYFRTAFEESSIAQVRYDADGRPVTMNSAALSLFGIRSVAEARAISIQASKRIPEDSKAQLFAGHRIRYEDTYDFAAMNESGYLPTSRSDVRYVDVYMFPLFDRSTGAIAGYLAQIADITERKEAEAGLKDAERLAGIGETAAMIGHDLRNPLQGLQYIVDLQTLRFERVPPEKRNAEDWQKEAELFNKISEQIYYMDKIVGDLQDYARPLDPEREAVSVRKLIGDVLESLPHSDGKVEINTDLSDTIVEVEPHLMRRAFSNLALNAIQAMPDGGVLSITARLVDSCVAMSFTDTGVGIPDEMKRKLFSPLMTGKAKGTGLGLAVVKRIVDAHGGTVAFESEKGKGTTFTVTLPASYFG